VVLEPKRDGRVFAKTPALLAQIPHNTGKTSSCHDLNIPVHDMLIGTAHAVAPQNDRMPAFEPLVRNPPIVVLTAVARVFNRRGVYMLSAIRVFPYRLKSRINCESLDGVWVDPDDCPTLGNCDFRG
jgi:hypothetical protein